MNAGQLSSSAAIWVFIWLALYFAYLVFWAMRGSAAMKTMEDLSLAGRGLSVWTAVTAATIASLTGWLFAALPGLLLRDGFPAGYLAFAAIGIPALGAFLARRQWILGRKHGFLTAGEMFAAYFGGNVVRVFSVLVAVLLCVPFLALLLDAAAQMISIASNRVLDPLIVMWTIAAAITIIATLGGLLGVARSGPLQMTMVVVGVGLTGLAAYHVMGGFDAMKAGLAQFAQAGSTPWGTTGQHGGGDYNSHFALSGVVQWTHGIGRDVAQGGPWTSALALTFVLSLLGIQTSPVMTMFAFASGTPNANAPQQVWASAAVMGLLLFVFVPLIGIGGLLLGAAGPVAGHVQQLLPDLSAGQHGLVSAALLHSIGTAQPWLGALLAACLLVAFTGCAAAYVIAGGATVTRDLFVAFFKPKASEPVQKVFARVVMLILTASAVIAATFFHDGVVAIGSAALTLAIQLLPAYLAVTWVPWFTRKGVQAGLIVGAIVAIFADPLGQAIAMHNLPWGFWPWTIHAAAWGLAANFTVCILGSAVSQSDEERIRRDAFHALFAPAGGPRASRRITATAWVVTMTWTFLALGPGATIGNYLFGEPSAPGEWALDIPSIWGWQLIWWCVGVLLVWFLAFGLRLSFNGRNEGPANGAASAPPLAPPRDRPV
jgi:Na+/proline symporter